MRRAGSNRRAASASVPVSAKSRARQVHVLARHLVMSFVICSHCLISAGPPRDEGPCLRPSSCSCHPGGTIQVQGGESTPLVVEVAFQSFQSARRACAAARLVGVSCSSAAFACSARSPARDEGPRRRELTQRVVARRRCAQRRPPGRRGRLRARTRAPVPHARLAGRSRP